ncbi:hypothetical protein O9929_13895 [Vibrio lentus]|nr:hypothetical protein [Vibrio lentus]
MKFQYKAPIPLTQSQHSRTEDGCLFALFNQRHEHHCPCPTSLHNGANSPQRLLELFRKRKRDGGVLASNLLRPFGAPYYFPFGEVSALPKKPSPSPDYNYTALRRCARAISSVLTEHGCKVENSNVNYGVDEKTEQASVNA